MLPVRVDCTNMAQNRPIDRWTMVFDQSTRSELRSSDRAALMDGRHGLGPEGGLNQIKARYARFVADSKESAACAWARLEGQANSALRRSEEADARWTFLQLETQGEEPELAVPLFWILVALGLLGGETIFLGPFLDGIGAANAVTQLIIAGCAVLAWTGIVETAAYLAARGVRVGRIIGIVILAVSALALVGLGWWRADVLARSSHNPALQAFFRDHPTSTTLALVTLTVLFPSAAALALWRHLPELCGAARWHGAGRDARRWREQVHALRAEQQALGASLNMTIERLGAEEREACERYLKHYRLGARLNGVKGGAAIEPSIS
jgi:hypothetical protein